MEALEKLTTLARDMALETAEELKPAPRPTAPVQPKFTQGYERAPCGSSPAQLKAAYESTMRNSVSAVDQKKNSLGIHNAVMPGGKRIALLKTMLTSACERNCNYCPFRAGRSMRRATFKPEEMAQVFTQMHKAGDAEGLFLSSGIIGGSVRTQDKLLDTVDIIRRKHAYRGYLHLKLMPGSEKEQVRRAMMLTDRISLNLEGTSQKRVNILAPKKDFERELIQPLIWANEIRRAEPHRRWASSVTQFVIGPAGESDVEVLSVTDRLNKQAGLTRAYFSAFSPVKDTPFENTPAEDPWREHRLYQSSYLLRDYGFELEELPFNADGRLPVDEDPKLAWARANLHDAPVEVNTADKRDLLRVPGIGPKGVMEILTARRAGKLRDLKDLAALGVLANRAAPFVLLAGKRAWQGEQMALL